MSAAPELRREKVRKVSATETPTYLTFCNRGKWDWGNDDGIAGGIGLWEMVRISVARSFPLTSLRGHTLRNDPCKLGCIDPTWIIMKIDRAHQGCPLTNAEDDGECNLWIPCGPGV